MKKVFNHKLEFARIGHISGFNLPEDKPFVVHKFESIYRNDDKNPDRADRYFHTNCGKNISYMEDVNYEVFRILMDKGNQEWLKICPKCFSSVDDFAQAYIEMDTAQTQRRIQAKRIEEEKEKIREQEYSKMMEAFEFVLSKIAKSLGLNEFEVDDRHYGRIYRFTFHGTKYILNFRIDKSDEDEG